MTPEQREDAKLQALGGILQNTQNTAELLARLLLLMEAATGFRQIPPAEASPSALIIPPGVEIPGDRRICRVCGCTDDHRCPNRYVWIEDDLCSSCAGTELDPPRSPHIP